MELNPGTQVDRYVVQSVLGEGGMAVVYLCRHDQLGTMHALKVLTMTSRAVRQRLVQEGRLQAQLRHPNIVAVTDIITLNGAPGLVMEYIEGPSLDDLLNEKSLSFEQADALAEGILAGVAHAHAQGLVHRDLKPANIMLAVENGTLVPKVMDFGLAKLLESEPGSARTRTGSTMGTPHYMSPEQVSDSKNVDGRTDVFALGAILYELVTGYRAFGGENLLQIFSAVASARFKPPKQLRPDLPDRMERAILGALEPDKDARIQSVEQLAAVWSGKAHHVGGAQPQEPAGPFSADFISSLSTGSQSSESTSHPTFGIDALPDAPAAETNAISVESLYQGPPVDDAPPAFEPPPPAPAPVDMAVVPPPPQPGQRDGGVASESVVSGTSLVVGGGAAFFLAAGLGAVGLVLVALAGGLLWTFNTKPSPRRTVDIEVPDVEPVAPVPSGVDGTPEPAPSPEPEPASAPSPVPSPVPSVAPTPTPGPVPMTEPASPDPEPTTEPEPADTPEPEPTDEPEPVAAASTGALDPRLESSDAGDREAGIVAIRERPEATDTLIALARNDPENGVRAKAWNAIRHRYENGIGARGPQEALIVESLSRDGFSRREAAYSYSRVGSDLDLLLPLLETAGPTELKSVVDSVVRLAKRTGQEEKARTALERAHEQAHPLTRPFIKRGLNRL
jgi:serine/threonine-protein kinase